jgi:hypothetical protein
MQHKIGTFAEWPKPLGLIFIAVFGVLTLTILTWMYQDTVEIVWSSHRLLFSWKFVLEFLYLARQPTTQIRYGLAKTCSKPQHGLILCVVT